ncbi:PKD domain-containing protein [Gynurincola endophyticus]|uniref:PKD domain-containing protein n=1 Tax=Gynurincola endophyticus TaxID=2479004 RepID=UPI000F8C6618|nr:PKD domain-containing protein [Gynurincola endophyticus]
MKSYFAICAFMLTVLFACKKDEIDYTIVPKIGADNFEVLAESTVKFIDESEGLVSKWFWEFEGGTPATSELSGPEVFYAAPGKYRVKLVVKNSNFETTLVKEELITVGYNQITPDFEFDKAQIIQDESVQFTDKTTGLPTEWLWTFTNENNYSFTSTEKSPLIKFEEPGIYTVTLKAKNPVSEKEIIKEDVITVIDLTAVNADFKATTTATYTGAQITFSDLSIGTVENRTWTFEGGSPATSSDASPVVTYSTPGRYKVTLHVSNSEKSSTKEVEHYMMVVPGNQLAMFFPFNEVLADAGPAAMLIERHGTIDTVTVNDRFNNSRTTASFSGTQGILVKSNGIMNLGLNDFTISVWVKTNSSARMVLWQEAGKNQTGDNQSWLRLNDNTTDRRMRFNTEAPGGGSIINLGEPGDLRNNVWRHVVCVREGTSMRVYVDNIMVGSMTTPNIRNVSGDQDFKIAFQEGPTSFSNFLIGALDDLIIYKKALTAQEITDLFNL